MAEFYKFFDTYGEDRRTYNTSEISEYFGDFLSSGIYNKESEGSFNLVVSASGTDMQTFVKEGKALIKGYAYKNTDDLYLMHNAAEPVLDRIDRIVIRLDKTNENRYVRAFIKKGISDANPVPPDLQRDNDIYEIALAQVLIIAGKSFIEASQITDERTDEGLCGFVASLISVPTSQFQAEFDGWMQTTIDDYNSIDIVELRNQIEKPVVQSLSLVKGSNTITVPTPSPDTPYNVLSAQGKTIINHARLFNSGAWNIHANATVTSPTKLTLNVTSIGQISSLEIAVIEGKTYTLSLTRSGRFVVDYLTAIGGVVTTRLHEEGETAVVGLLTVTFTVPVGSKAIKLYATNNSATGTFTFEDVMLNEGITAQEFVANIKHLTNIAIENQTNGTCEYITTTLAKMNGVYDELLSDSQGNLFKRKWFEQIELTGSLGWVFDNDYVGYKRVKVLGLLINAVDDTGIGVKYDGKILENRTTETTNASDQIMEVLPNGDLYITISDTDSGWADGWNGSTILTASTFSISRDANMVDLIKARFNGWKFNGNPNGDGSNTDARWEGLLNPSITTKDVETVINTSPSGHVFDSLTYQRATSIDVPVSSEGQVILQEGTNTLDVKEGIVVREVANIEYDSGNKTYRINTTPGVNSLKYGTSKSFTIYKNGKDDSANWAINPRSVSVGNGTWAFIPASQFDPTATYTVTYYAEPYQITPNVETIDGEYAKNVIQVLNQHTEQLKNVDEELASLPDVYTKRVQEDWIPIIGENGWVSHATYTAYYRKDTLGRVQIKGLLQGGTKTSGIQLFTLPKEYRPTENRYITTFSDDATGSSGVVGMIRVESGTGGVFWHFVSPTVPKNSISLDTISFETT